MEFVDILQNERVTLTVRSEDLREFASILAEKILSERNCKSDPKSEKPLTQDEAIQFLGKSRQTFVNWRKKGLINAYTVNGRIYYKPSELMSALQKIEVQ